MNHLGWYLEIGGIVAAGVALVARAVRSAEVKAKREERGGRLRMEERGEETGMDGGMPESSWGREV